MSSDPNELSRKLNQANEFFNGKALTIVKVEGVKHFKGSFHNEGFTDKALEPWPDISEARKSQKRRRNGNLPPILTDTGDLGNSITGSVDGQEVIFSTDKPYAARHNEGLDGMPERQFMGPSEVLDQNIINKFESVLDKIFNA